MGRDRSIVGDSEDFAGPVKRPGQKGRYSPCISVYLPYLGDLVSSRHSRRLAPPQLRWPPCLRLISRYRSPRGAQLSTSRVVTALKQRLPEHLCGQAVGQSRLQGRYNPTGCGGSSFARQSQQATRRRHGISSKGSPASTHWMVARLMCGGGTLRFRMR